jgi:hypothetical protein
MRYLGMDVHGKATVYCLLDAAGNVVEVRPGDREEDVVVEEERQVAGEARGAGGAWSARAMAGPVRPTVPSAAAVARAMIARGTTEERIGGEGTVFMLRSRAAGVQRAACRPPHGRGSFRPCPPPALSPTIAPRPRCSTWSSCAASSPSRCQTSRRRPARLRSWTRR